MTKPERVILVKGDATQWYEQAIFIVKQNPPPGNLPKDMVAEAENIIRDYLVKNRRPVPAGFPGGGSGPVQMGYAPYKTAKKPARTRTDFLLNVIMVLACVAIAAVFAYGMLV
jgi:hypothetical protein